MRAKWEKSIHRADFKANSSSVVCIKHFDEQFIERNNQATRPDGTILVLPRERPVLKPGAFPSKFQEQPSYLTEVLPPKRKEPSERAKEIDQRYESDFQNWHNEDHIKDFRDFMSKLEKRLTSPWSIVSSSSDNVFLGKIDVSDIPQFITSIRISQTLQVTVWNRQLLVPKSNLEWVLGKEQKCSTWSTFECLLSHLNSYATDTSLELKLKGISDLLSNLIEQCEQTTIKDILLFITEQLQLCLMKSPRYSPRMLIWASKFFFAHPAAYRLVRNSGTLILPHPFYLKSLLRNFGRIESGIQGSTIKYLKNKCLEISEQERIVGLMMDEIYVKPNSTYKGGKIEGLAVNTTCMEASAIQSFMLSSLFSKNKDIVGLYPMKNQTAEDLCTVLEEVLQILVEAGYTALYVISDNNRINRNAYEILCEGTLKPSIKYPRDSNKVLFLLFDSVHLIKSVRNNWLNQKESNQTFFIPPMHFLKEMLDSTVLYASIQHLKAIYREESKNFVKIAPSLCQKALYPTNMERQNVGLALKLFDEKLIAALKEYEERIGKDAIGTSLFIEIFSKFWKIMNVKTLYKGEHKRDQFCEPITDPDCSNLEFLEKFSKWLEKWESMPPPSFAKSGRTGKLSKETSFALIHTCKTVVLMCKHLFKNIVPRPKYILLGKIQTDSLEARFGQYRGMSGGNYHVSVAQVLESERKLKVLNLLTLKSAEGGNFTIKNFFASCKESDNSSELTDDFLDVIFISDDVEISEDNLKALIFIGGYIARKASEPCLNCRQFLSCDQELCLVDEKITSYIEQLDRGGLLWPNELNVEICALMFRIFQTCISEAYEGLFLKVKNVKFLLCELAKEKVTENKLVSEAVCHVQKFHYVFPCLYHSFKYSDLEMRLKKPPERNKMPDTKSLIFGKNFSDHMLEIEWSEDTGWSKPLISPMHDFVFHPASKVLHYAQELFEGLKAFKSEDGRVLLFRPELNIERMLKTAERASLPNFDGEEFLKCLKKLISIDKACVPQDENCSLYIRPTLIGTEPSLGIAPAKKALLFVITGPVGAYFPIGTEKPVSLLADPKYLRSWPGGVGDKKMGCNYAPTVYVQKIAEAKNHQQVLWLYGDDHRLVEVGTMNIFVYMKNKNNSDCELITPPLDGLILPGIIRRSLLDLAHKWGEFQVSERYITMHEIIEASKEKRLLEIFGSGTACVVCPVGSITYMGGTINVPTTSSLNPLYKKFSKALKDIQYGRTPSEWSVPVD